MQEAMTYKDADLADRLTQMRDAAAADDQAPTLTRIAQMARINRATVSLIANRRQQPTQEQEAALWEAIRACESMPEAAREQSAPPRYKRSTELYRTKEYIRAYAWLDWMRVNRKMGVMTGHPGSGKTTVLKSYLKDHAQCRYIECWDTMHMGDLLDEMASALGIAASGTVYQRTRRIERELSGRTDIMLLCDEADQLHKWDVSKFETLRKLCDNSHTPLIMAGTMRLQELLTRGGGKDNLAQLYRRNYGIELGGVRAGEVREILREYDVDAEAAAELTRLATDLEHGGMGNFTEVLEIALQAADGGRVTCSVVAGAEEYKLLY